MEALIIGGGGFVGSYLARHLSQEKAWTTGVTKLPHETVSVPSCEVFDLDLLDGDSALQFLDKARPNRIFHLAAQSSVALSWKNPEKTVEINIRGCLRLLEAVRRIPDYNPRILLVGSGEEYGFLPRGVTLVNEDTPVHPGNPYAVTKVAQNLFGAIYAYAYHMDVLMVRAFNHVGPGQSPQFVVSDFCKQAAEIAKKQRQDPNEPGVMQVGNLMVGRDFTDVRDVVRAYAMLSETGKAGETYNVGSGKTVLIDTLLREIIRQSGARIQVKIDPKKLRPADVPVIRADITKLRRDTAWYPQIPLEQTIKETLEYWERGGKE